MLISLLITITSVAADFSSARSRVLDAVKAVRSASSATCRIAGQMSRDCYSNCVDYCESHDFCQLDYKKRSSWPWRKEFCGWAWQAKCVCKQCPGGFCDKARRKLDSAILIARTKVQRRIDDLTNRTHTRDSNLKCADAGEMCECDGEVRYGANGIFSDWKPVSGSVRCNDDVFGNPISGPKACYCVHQWKHHCADDNGICECDGLVQYGANGKFSEWKPVSREINCDSDVFGDPIPHVDKSCYCKRSDYASENRNQWCADWEDRMRIPGCDGVDIDKCWKAGVKLCNSLGDYCYGVMINAGWTFAYKGVKICLSSVMVDKGDWVTRMKYTLESGNRRCLWTRYRNCNIGGRCSINAVYSPRLWWPSLDAAKNACNNLPDCTGITRDDGGYEPRRGTHITQNKAAHEVWMCDTSSEVGTIACSLWQKIANTLAPIIADKGCSFLAQTECAFGASFTAVWVCETVGLGPENPLSEMCVWAVESAILWGCMKLCNVSVEDAVRQILNDLAPRCATSEAPTVRADYGDMISAQWCRDHENRKDICDGGLYSCWEAGMNLCDSEGASCFGVMLHNGWTQASRGVKLCLSNVMVDKGDWLTRMKISSAADVCIWEESTAGVDLAPSHWNGSPRTSLDQCKANAEAARVSYFAWSGQIYGGYCKVLKPSVANPNLGTNQGYGYKLWEKQCSTPLNTRMIYKAIGICSHSGYYSGYGGKENDSLDACNQLCLNDPQCNYVSFRAGDSIPTWQGIRCTRHKGDSQGKCTVEFHRDWITYEKEEYITYDPNLEDDWKKYFGNRNNQNRKPFAIQVLKNLNRALWDLKRGQELGRDGTVSLLAQPLSDENKLMTCNLGYPCYGGEEKQWPDKIGIYVNTKSDKLLNASPDTIAALIIARLSSSTAIASRKNLTVTGSDVPMSQANVGHHSEGSYLATRTWVDNSNYEEEIKNYATCYESGRNCPAGGYNNRPQATRNMDVPLNSADTFAFWITGSKAAL